MAATRSRSQRGQILVQIVLILTPILAIIGLSLSSALLMHTKTRLDQASLSAAVGAASDACMASPYGFDLFECTAGGVHGEYQANGIEPIPAAGPGLTAPVVTTEQTIAYDSANQTVLQILGADYPGFTYSECPTAATSAACAGMVTSAANPTKTIVYQIQVGLWYQYDGDDVPGSASDDAAGYNEAPPFSVSTSDGTLAADSDVAPGNALVCPATDPSLPAGTTQFGRQVIVSFWTQSTPPFGAFLGGVGSVPLQTSATAFGCART